MQQGGMYMANYTPNYQLHQWEPEDPFLRTDFNQDLSKIDTALDGLADKATALEAAVVLCGNCQIWTAGYVGTGEYGADKTNHLILPKKPIAFWIFYKDTIALSVVSTGTMSTIDNGGLWGSLVAWDEAQKKLSWWSLLHPDYQMNRLGREYAMVALMSMDK